MSPPRRNSASARPSLARQASLTNEAPAAAAAPGRRPLLRRQRSAEDDRPITQLLHSALKVTASALGPGLIQPPPSPPPKQRKSGPLRPVRVAWAELRAAGRDHPEPSPKQPTCLPALARANLDIFLAHSGLAQCLANIDLGRQQSPKGEPVRASPREAPIKAALTPIALTAAATSRRISFKTAGRSVINRSFNDSPEPQKLALPAECKSARILSAPAHRTAPILTPPRPMLRSLPRRSPLNSSFESETSADTRVKSAPSRRRLKSAGRGGSRKSGSARKGEESSDDEDIFEPPPAAAPPRPPSLTGSSSSSYAPKISSSRRGLRVGAEIVTMVSLISPANSSDESESEATPGSHQVVPAPGAEAAPAWQAEGADEAKTRNPPLAIVCARKINKSVSFQSRSSLPELLRRASIQLTTSCKSDKEEGGGAVRDEKGPSAPATAACAPETKGAEIKPPAATPGIMKAPIVRRKLTKPNKALLRQNSKSESESKTSKDISSDSQSVSSAESVIRKEPDKLIVANNSSPPISILKPASAPLASAEEMDFAAVDASPTFESPKEQECWHLYRKMCEKGLTVSFDTVLRGMLTPTEYRLRKGALLSSC